MCSLDCVCVCVSGDQSDRGWFPVASSSELPLLSAPVDVGLLAEGADGEAELHSDPQRSQQNHAQPRQHRLVHAITQVPRPRVPLPGPNTANMNRISDEFWELEENQRVNME